MALATVEFHVPWYAWRRYVRVVASTSGPSAVVVVVVTGLTAVVACAMAPTSRSSV